MFNRHLLQPPPAPPLPRLPIENNPLRDHFAGLALMGALAYPGTKIAAKNTPQDYAELAYQMADAMLSERAK
ncbi:MAG: hypothetical protein V4448_17630 [Pseudomonadota bacterium]